MAGERLMVAQEPWGALARLRIQHQYQLSHPCRPRPHPEIEEEFREHDHENTRSSATCPVATGGVCYLQTPRGNR